MSLDMDTSKKILVSQSFIDDFEAVAIRYNLKETGEYEIAKQAARNDLENAIATYSALAREEA